MVAVVPRPGANSETPPNPDGPDGPAAAEGLSAANVTQDVAARGVEDASAPDRGETVHALRNALKLGGSLGLTLALSFGVKLFLPRYLGPTLFGPLNFAEAFTTAFFVVVNLGVDIYIRRELPVRPEHGDDFAAGVLFARLLMGALVFVAMGVVMGLGHKAPEVQRLVFVFGVGQMFVATNQSLSALLHSKGKVDGLSLSNVASKVLWGVCILTGLYFGLAALSVPLALVVSEMAECATLIPLARKHLGLRFQVNLAATWAVIAASVPFYLNLVSHTVYARLDVSMLEFMGEDREVGWYGAASNLAGLTLLMTPLIGWVLTPLYSRASARSDEAFNQILRRSLELILTLGFPVSLMLGVGADVWIHLAFGKAYAPAAMALRLLAPNFLITYVAMLSATCLINVRRAWTMTFISMGGLFLNPVLNYFLIRQGLAMGPSYGGAAAAVANVLTEVAVTGVMMVLMGSRAFDRRSLVMLGKTLAVCGAVIALDRLLAPRLGAWRLVPDALLYTAGVLGTRAVRLHEMVDFLRSALSRRGNPDPETA